MIAYHDNNLGARGYEYNKYWLTVGFNRIPRERDRRRLFFLAYSAQSCWPVYRLLAKTKYELVIASFCEVHKHVSRITSFEVDVLIVSNKWLIAGNGTAD